MRRARLALQSLANPSQPAVLVTALLADNPTTRSLLHRLGFIVSEAPSTTGSIGAWWKAAYARAPVWTFNPPGLRPTHKTVRIGLWMTMESFLARYGSKSPPASGSGSLQG
jgi:integrase